MSNERLTSKVIKKHIMLIVLMLIMSAVYVQAKVYFRWGAADNLTRYLSNLGGRVAYQTNMLINGESGTVSVIGFPEPKSAWGSSMHSISITKGRMITTLLGIQLSGKPLLFKIERPDNLNAPSTHYLNEIPPYPQSEPAFYARDNNTRMELSVSRSNASPGDVRSFYRGAMEANGWRLPAPATANGSIGMSVYLKEKAIACVSVDIEKTSGDTRISLLYKKQGIK